MESNILLSEEVNETFDQLTDEDIILEIKTNCDNQALDYLINKYRPFVRAKTRT